MKTAEAIREEAKSEIAKQYHVGTTLVMGHKEKYWNQAMDRAMESYHQSKLEESGKELPSGEEILRCSCPDLIIQKDEWKMGANWMKSLASQLLTKKEDMFSRMQNHLLDIQKNKDKEIAELREELENTKGHHQMDIQSYDKQISELKGANQGQSDKILKLEASCQKQSYEIIALKEDAIGFAEWILKSDWQQDNDAWVIKAGNYVHGIIKEVKSTSDLYSQYQQSKQKLK